MAGRAAAPMLAAFKVCSRMLKAPRAAKSARGCGAKVRPHAARPPG